MAVVRMAVLHPGHTLGDKKPLLRAGLVRNFVEVLLRLNRPALPKLRRSKKYVYR